MFSDFVQGGCKEVKEHRRNKAMVVSYVPGAATSAYLGTKQRAKTMTANNATAPRWGRNATPHGREMILLPEQRQSRVGVDKTPILTQQGRSAICNQSLEGAEASYAGHSVDYSTDWQVRGKAHSRRSGQPSGVDLRKYRGSQGQPCGVHILYCAQHRVRILTTAEGEHITEDEVNPVVQIG